MSQHATLLRENEATIVSQWLARLEKSSSRLLQVSTKEERTRLSERIVRELIQATASGDLESLEGAQFEGLRDALTDLSANLAERGLTPSETATYIFSLKEVLFTTYRDRLSAEDATTASWEINVLLDKLGLFTFEAYSIARERIVKSQAQALAELSTPVIQVWEGIIALPLVGAIDSARAKDIMENLLDAVVTYSADIVIIDITGVPVVDTQVANRLMRTVEAVRLLGTRSIITGINPVIAQTLVQLGVDLGHLTTKASLRAGLQQAFRDLKLKVVAAEAKVVAAEAKR